MLTGIFDVLFSVRPLSIVIVVTRVFLSNYTGYSTFADAYTSEENFCFAVKTNCACSFSHFGESKSRLLS